MLDTRQSDRSIPPHAPASFNLVAPESLRDPYPLYQQMRATAPVYYADNLGFWVLTRHDDVTAGLLDKRLSSDRSELFVRQMGDLDLGLIKNFLALFGKTMIEMDPPQHTAIRKIANQGFKNKALASWESIIQRTTDELFDRVEAQGRMDIVTDFSIPLPALIIADIFGIPQAERQNVIKWGKDLGVLWGAPAGIDIEEVARRADDSAAEFSTMIQALIAERRQRPGSDMISLLVMAYEQHGLSLAQLPSLCIEILNGGVLTTNDLIPNGIHALLSFPAQLVRLVDQQNDPAVVRTAIAEMIRYDSPVPFLFRIAKEELLIRGQRIPAGSVVALGLGAANHDPDVFADPEGFDITRSPNDHLGFGRGSHFCIGSVLARMELEIAFKTLLQRLPKLRMDPSRPAVLKHQSIVFKGFESLPVRFG